MTQTTMEQTLSYGWPKRFISTLTAYDITRVWEAGTRFILSLLTLTILLGLAGGVVKTFSTCGCSCPPILTSRSDTLLSMR